MDGSKNYVVLSKDEIKSCRHKAEKRWYRRLVIINLIMIIGIISFCYINYEKNLKTIHHELTKMEQSINEDDTDTDSDQYDIEKFKDNMPMEVQFLVMGIFILVFFPIAINIMYASYKSMAIRITKKNFPEVYERIEEYSHRLGLKKVPEAYILQQNGILNAFSSFILRKQYIEIDADLFEIAYREYKDIDALSFVIAHELSHIKLKHATFWYNIGMLYSGGIPIIGSTASRAREYSCDRLAQRITGNDGVEAMLSLMAGKHLYKDVDVDDYIENTENVKGFFVWCCNLLADHPIMTKRIRALIEKDKSGKLY